MTESRSTTAVSLIGLPEVLSTEKVACSNPKATCGCFGRVLYTHWRSLKTAYCAFLAEFRAEHGTRGLKKRFARGPPKLQSSPANTRGSYHGLLCNAHYSGLWCILWYMQTAYIYLAPGSFAPRSGHNNETLELGSRHGDFFYIL